MRGPLVTQAALVLALLVGIASASGCGPKRGAFPLLSEGDAASYVASEFAEESAARAEAALLSESTFEIDYTRRYLDNALALSPNEALLHHARSTLHETEQDPKALYHLSRAVQLDPSRTEWQIDLVDELFRHDELEAARVLAERLGASDVDLPEELRSRLEPGEDEEFGEFTYSHDSEPLLHPVDLGERTTEPLRLTVQQGHEFNISTALTSRDGRLLITAGSGGRVVISESTSGRLVQSLLLKGALPELRTVMLGDEELLLAFGEGQAAAWSLNDLSLRWMIRAPGPEDSAAWQYFEWSLDEARRRLFVYSRVDDKTARVGAVNIETGAMLDKTLVISGGDHGYIELQAMGVTANGLTMVMSGSTTVVGSEEPNGSSAGQPELMDAGEERIVTVPQRIYDVDPETLEVRGFAPIRHSTIVIGDDYIFSLRPFGVARFTIDGLLDRVIPACVESWELRVRDDQLFCMNNERLEGINHESNTVRDLSLLPDESWVLTRSVVGASGRYLFVRHTRGELQGERYAVFDLEGDEPREIHAEVLIDPGEDVAVTYKLFSASLAGDQLLVQYASEDGRTVEPETTRIDMVSGERLAPLATKHYAPALLASSPDFSALALTTIDGPLVVWQLAGGAKHMEGTAGLRLAWSPTGDRVASVSQNGNLKVWDALAGAELTRIPMNADYMGLAPLVFADDDTVFTPSMEGDAITAYRLADGSRYGSWPLHRTAPWRLGRRHDGQIVVTTDMGAGVIDPTRDGFIAPLGLPRHTSDSAISGDGTRFARVSEEWSLTGKGKMNLEVADTVANELLWVSDKVPEYMIGLAFDPASERLAVAMEDRVDIYDANNGTHLTSLGADWYPGEQLVFPRSISFSPDSRRAFVIASDGMVHIYDVSSGVELCRLFVFRDGTWAVVDREGRYDAADGGEVDGIHFVAGAEVIALEQLKERFYEPGLLSKHLGTSSEPLRPVETFDHVDLYPSIELREIEDGGHMEIELHNRGGGIGRIEIYVNGRQIMADARGGGAEGVDPDAATATVEINVSDHPAVMPGEENTVEVRVLNKDGYLASRGVSARFIGDGRADTDPPSLFAVVVGVSDYTGDSIDLRYASHDAVQFAAVLERSARKLFGAEHVDLQLLSSESGTHPSRENIRAAFAQVGTRAAAGDIIVTYFAGHGVELSHREDTYAFLTANANGTELTDPAVVAKVAITHHDLTGWLQGIAANKQVLILDTCASGAMVREVTETRSRSTDQVRAIERVKDATGTHILMGSAADAVSYEATRYGQGLLTYALLQAMKGAALREDRYVDVGLLFRHAADTVPRLARHIGGVQQPVVSSPSGQTFDIGRLESDDRAQIKLPAPIPLVVRPIIHSPSAIGDPLGLTTKVGYELRELSESGFDAGLVYVDASEMPEAISPRGNYEIDARGRVSVKLRLWRDSAPLGDIEVTGEAEAADVLARSISAEIGRFLKSRPAIVRGENDVEPAE